MSAGERPGPRPMAQRKARDRAVILPALGLILLMPPFAGVFEVDVKLGGVPVILIYLFVVWAALILGAFRLSRRLDSGAGPGGAD